MSSSSMSSVTKVSAGTPDYLYQVKLLSALRSGDPAAIHPFLTDIASRKAGEGGTDFGALAVHLAVRCASYDTVALLLSHRAISPNAVYPPDSGTTTLHLAASIARTDVVNLLLEQEEADDSLRDANGKTCLEVAKGKDTIRALQDSRAFLNANYRSLLRTYVLSPTSAPPPDALLKLISSPRARSLDLSYLDDSTGRSLLHEAARRKDLRLVELAVRAGADVFVRDRRGRRVGEGLGKDDRVRVFLRQFQNQDTSLIKQPTSSEPPELRGYLNKYTNVAKGYNTRWFVLKNGVLSYYRHQEDENVASRGSIAMRTAALHVAPNASSFRFEVHSTQTHGHSQKWYLKANHPVEAARWVQALKVAIERARHESERRSAESDAPSSVRTFASSRRSVLPQPRPSSLSGRSVSRASSQADDDDGEVTPGPEPHPEKQLGVVGGVKERGETSSEEELQSGPPHAAAFALQGHALEAQAELAVNLVRSLPVRAEAGDASRAAEDTVGTLHGMLGEYVQMVRDREEWWRGQLERERERQAVWEESLQAVVKEGDVLERALREKSRRRSRSRMEGTLIASTESTVRATVRTSPAIPPALVQSPAEEPQTPPLALAPAVVPASPAEKPVVPRQPSTGQISVKTRLTVVSATCDADSFVDTDEEDEFFDAIESGNLPNLIVSQTLRQPATFWIQLNKDQYGGYQILRPRLAITSDDRPPMSLWAVLKNSIGKDLTKISFPVFFNEPTSMLQRMAEDMEFSECLDAAAAEDDPHKRIAFVAAFAMSNYSSTIGRIAKPFNPMLGETFEYVRFDKDYRYISEQVSHHPPISACWAESPSWHYYGEVDAQNKFMGKSFEIRPTGIAHAELLLPEEKAPQYPKAKASHLAGKVVEHYSWKKVTTNVSGFILGSPTIDHYGDMVITNHRTGDQCVLAFKPRGWRGKDAYEISGYVADASGTVTYEIAGRWNSQLVARRVGTGHGQLLPDVSVTNPNSPSYAPEYILLWRNSEKPTAPFNLTPFAITLNDCPDTLRPYVSPTDCRLRPDQRAFELGKYERANELKNNQEDFQRATRRAREEGRLPPHKPRWFTAETEPDTGERVWTPHKVEQQLEYWLERDNVYKAKQADQDASWKDVDNIFIDDDPFNP